MPAAKQNSFLRRFFWSKGFLFAGFIVMGFILFGLFQAYYQSYKVNEEIKSLKNQVASLEKKKIESMEILSYVMGNDFVEDKARTELNLKKEGEHVMLFSGGEAEPEPKKIAEQVQSRQVLSNAIKWWYYFFSKHN